MVDIVGLGLIVVSAYVLIKYGPQIASNIQTGQPPLAGVVPTAQAASSTCPDGSAPAADGSCPPTAAAPTALPAGPGLVTGTTTSCGAGTHYNIFTGNCDADVAAAPTTCPSGFTDFLGTCVKAAAPTSSSPAQPTTLNSPSGTPKLTNQHCVPGTGPGTGQPCLPIIGGPNTRPAKKAVPPHAAPRCLCSGGIHQGANCPTRGEICTKSSNVGYSQASVGYFDSYNIPVEGPQWYRTIPAGEYQANMTQVVNGKSVTTIDEYMPSGFVLGQANAKSSKAAAFQ